tara:strand:+ start:5959 stop:7755 length:1797 start_codon:yes stop_codon:yes gene_type:complete
MPKKIVPIDYTKRDFDSIKESLIEYAKRYYPDTYKDFNASSFGSLMVDLLSYVGDSLSFYLDYSANESFMETSFELDNVVNHAKQLGYRHSVTRTSVGEVTFFIPLPADTTFNEKPDLKYIPRIAKGSTVSTSDGRVFTLAEEIEPYELDPEVIAYNFSADGTKITYFILKVTGEVLSGEESSTVIDVGDFARFPKVEVPDTVAEIISVHDSAGNEYYQVDFLSQNIIYRSVVNASEERGENTNFILKPFPVTRRFVLERSDDRTYLVFGYGSEHDLKNNRVADPSEVVIKRTGKNYITDRSFDPNKFMSTDKFGIAPVNTELTINYRRGSARSMNAGANSIDTVVDLGLDFDNESSLEPEKVRYIRENIEVLNENPINGDVSIPTTEEIKRRALANFATQKRAVSRQDYVASAYAMPSHLGSIKRCAINRDINDYRRNLNMYIISENSSGHLEKPSSPLKRNLKTWLTSLKMVTDSIDIFDAKIINFKIEFEISAESHLNNSIILKEAKDNLFKKLTEIPPEIGEPFSISDVFWYLKEVQGVTDVINVKIDSASSINHSEYMHNIEQNISSEGRMIYVPKDFIWEVKYSSDIIGTVI